MNAYAFHFGGQRETIKTVYVDWKNYEREGGDVGR